MKRLGIILALVLAVFVARAFAHGAWENSLRNVISFATGATLPGSGNLCGSIITNAGALGSQVINLPPAVAGDSYLFVVMASQDLDINPVSDDQILLATNAAGDALSSDSTIGSLIELQAVDSTNWVVTKSVGTWTDVN